MADISVSGWKTLKSKADKAGLSTKVFDDAFGKKITDMMALAGKVNDHIKQIEKLKAEMQKLETESVRLRGVCKASAKEVISTAEKYKGKVTIQAANTPPKQAAAKEMTAFLDELIKRSKAWA